MKAFFRVAVVVSLISTGSLFATSNRITSADGSRSLVVNQAGSAVYHSGNGTITIELSSSGMKIGDFELRHEPFASHEGGSRHHLTVVNHGSAIDAEVELAENQVSLEEKNFDALKAELSRFARTNEGLLLQEAAALIAEQKAQGLDIAPPGTKGGVHAEWDGWSCTANVLNGVAAGAAMVGGCGTPACGPAVVYCCTSGIAWYGSSLIGISQNCNFLI